MKQPREYRRPIELLEPRRLFSTVTVADAATTEGAGSLAFTLTLDTPATEDVTVTYSTTPLTARPGKDYKPATGKATISAGATSAVISVPLVHDNVHEQSESFRLNLLRATGGGGATLPANRSATGTINDDDDAPAIFVSNTAVTEGNAGFRPATVIISLSAPSDRPVSVLYSTYDTAPFDGAASADLDYKSASGAVTFAPGQTSRTIRVLVKGDRACEGSESFRIRTASLADVAAFGEGVVHITNDDLPADADPTLTLSPIAPLLEGTGGSATPAAVILSLSHAVDHDVTVQYETTTGSEPPFSATGLLPLTYTDAATDDFTATTGSVTIPAGQTFATIPISVTADNAYEFLDEIFQLRLNSATGARFVNNAPKLSTQVIIRDDDWLAMVLPTPPLVTANMVQDVLRLPSTSAAQATLHVPDTTVVDVGGGLVKSGTSTLILNGSTNLVGSGTLASGNGALTLEGATSNFGATARVMTMGTGNVLHFPGGGLLTLTSDSIASLQSGALPFTIDLNGDGQVNADDYAFLDRAIARFQSDPPADGILRIELGAPDLESNTALA